MINVLFVCMGNICRSPTAHGVFESLVQNAGLSTRISVDSAGTHAWHIGKLPDARARDAALGRGYDLSGQRARQVTQQDFSAFEYVIAMDNSNIRELHSVAAGVNTDRISLLLSFDGKPQAEVPDPYYGDGDGFDVVLDLVEASCRGLLGEIRDRHGL